MAQAFMDLGSLICRPKNPTCLLCPLHDNCLAHKDNSESDYPKKAPKSEKPTRYTSFFWIEGKDNYNSLYIYTRRRPEKGLLGGMLEIPSSEWLDTKKGNEKDEAISSPFPLKWKKLDGQVKHSFTHFHLFGTIYKAEKPMINTETENWIRFDEFSEKAFPTLMKKVANHVYQEKKAK